MTAQIDLDELERKVREAADECEELPLNHRQALALIARIRELEQGIRDCDECRGWAPWQELMKILEKGMQRRKFGNLNRKRRTR